MTYMFFYEIACGCIKEFFKKKFLLFSFILRCAREIIVLLKVLEVPFQLKITAIV